jgi:hypothetical protein
MATQISSKMSDFGSDSGDDFDEDYDNASIATSLITESPTDGYFSPRDHPRARFVQNSAVQAQADNKERVAAQRPATTSETQRSSQSRPVESTPLLDAGPAPPDYATATANRREEASRRQGLASGTSSLPSSYGSILENMSAFNEPEPGTEQRQEQDRPWLFGNQGNPFGPNFPFGPNGLPFGNSTHAFTPWRQPEAMVDTVVHDGGEEQRPPGPRDSAWRRGRRRVRACCRSFSVVNLILVIALVVLSVALLTVLCQVDNDSGEGGGGESGGDSKLPGEDDGKDGLVGDPIVGDPTNDTIPTPPSNPACNFRYFSKTIYFGFPDIETFSLAEELESNHKTRYISGNIWVLPAPADQEVAVRAWVSYASSGAFNPSDLNYDFKWDSLAIALADDEPLASGCLDVSIRVFVKEGMELNDWTISTANLNVEFAEGLFGKGRDGLAEHSLWLANISTITATRGNIKAANWSSRETRIITSSGSIQGSFALRDDLTVRSSSGSIDIHVDPQAADAKKPAPAYFAMSSHSGSLKAIFTFEGEIPDRDYRTEVESRSSSISGSYIHGSETSFKSNSGNIEVTLLPYYAAQKDESELRTRGYSGATKVTILSPYKTKDMSDWRSNSEEDPGHTLAEKYGSYAPVFDNLRSRHTTTSGSLTLIYPQEWEGEIEGQTSSGSISVRGRDVHRYLDNISGPSGHHLVARKGYGSSKLRFKGTSGSVSLAIGDE